MGCNEDELQPIDQICEGYELAANLDFDTNNDGRTDITGDDYWNGGAGWLPIGDATNAYIAQFDGNNARETGLGADGGPYTISNLFINRTTGNYAGLFGRILGSEIWNVGVKNVDVTLTLTGVTDHVYVGGLAGRIHGGVIGVIVKDVYTTGEVSATATMTVTEKHLFAGGVAGTIEDGNVTSSYSWADVTAVTQSNASNIGPNAFAGGLFGAVGEHVQSPNAARVDASYAAGAVSATAPGGSGMFAQAGGLAGQLSKNATIRVSYARGSVTASAGGNAYEGGLVGFQRGNIEYSFATGEIDHENTDTGGLVGNKNSGTTTASYYNSETDGRTNLGEGTAKTTSQLQTPTAYCATNTCANTDIYKDWNLDLDNDDNDNSHSTGQDNPWDFGTGDQYPVLDYGILAKGEQRPVITLTLNPLTIYESVGGVTESTVTASSTAEWNHPLTVQVPQDIARYTVSNIAIAEGSKSGTETLTAINNKVDASDYVKTLNLVMHPAKIGSPATTETWASRGSPNPTLTIKDDDELAKPTGLKLSVDGTKIQADWTSVTGATGYRVEWNTSDVWTSIGPDQRDNVSGGSTVTYVIDPSTALLPNQQYYVRVIATKSNVDDSVPSDRGGHDDNHLHPGHGRLRRGQRRPD